MHWNSLNDFLAMGDHGPYVWGSLLVTALLLVVEPILVVRGRKKLLMRLRRQLRAETSEQWSDRKPPTRGSK